MYIIPYILPKYNIFSKIYEDSLISHHSRVVGFTLTFDKYVFPEPIELKKVLKDYIEDEVDDKYYIITEKAKKLIDSLVKEGKIPTERNGTERNGTERNGYN